MEDPVAPDPDVMGNAGPQLDPRRMFTRPEVWRAWELQGQTCNLCRRAIPFDLMHGDHIIAWSAGGATTFDNLQALCGSCNLRKGAGLQNVIAARFYPAKLRPGSGELRLWQMEALPIVMSAIRRKPVLIEACPGAGKTRFGLEVAYRLAEAGEISRVLIIVPTIGIADGWSAAAGRSLRHTPTLPLHGLREWRAVDPIGDGWLGAITTYQSVFAAPEMYRAHATDPGYRTLVIFDEVHHAGANASWGEAAQFSFSQRAHAILSLSGTPFRTDRDPIVFVPSLNGAAKTHYRYSYDDAIRDGVCRPVQFVEVRGATTFRTPEDDLQTITFDDRELTEAGERLRLRAALEWIDDRSIADKMLRDANNYLISLRARGDTDAAGLVVCVDPELSIRSFSKLDQTDHIGRRDGAESECVGPKLGVQESDEKNEENHNLRFNGIFRLLCVNISPGWIGSRRPLPVPRHWVRWRRFVRARWLLRLPDRDQRLAYALRGRWFRRQRHYRPSH